MKNEQPDRRELFRMAKDLFPAMTMGDFSVLLGWWEHRGFNHRTCERELRRYHAHPYLSAHLELKIKQARAHEKEEQNETRGT